MSNRIGALLTIRDDLDLIEQIESLGYHSVWAAEGFQRTSFSKLERWATVTDRLRLATGIVNVYSRSPGTIAQAIATLDEHSDGRAILGLGVASPGLVEEFHGIPFERPIERIAEYIRLVKQYLSGEGWGYKGEFFSPESTAFWDTFDHDPAQIPIYNAALGPRNVAKTGELADGWLPNLYPMDGFRQAMEWLANGADEAGRSVNDMNVAMYVLAAVSDDPERARTAAAKHVAFYLREVPGFYDRAAERAGFERKVSAVRRP